MCTTKLLFWNQYSPGRPGGGYLKKIKQICICMENNSPHRRHEWQLPFKRKCRNLFASFSTLHQLATLTAEHVYSGRPDDKFSIQGLLRSETSLNLLFTLNRMPDGCQWTLFPLLTVFAGKSGGQNHWSFGDYAIRRPFLAKFPAIPPKRFVLSSACLTHPTPLPTWCECRVWLGWCSAFGTENTQLHIPLGWFFSVVTAHILIIIVTLLIVFILW